MTLCEAPLASLSAALQGLRGFSSEGPGSETNFQRPSSGWPVMPGPLHGWAAEALVGSDRGASSTREMPGTLSSRVAPPSS